MLPIKWHVNLNSCFWSLQQSLTEINVFLALIISLLTALYCSLNSCRWTVSLVRRHTFYAFLGASLACLSSSEYHCAFGLSVIDFLWTGACWSTTASIPVVYACTSSFSGLSVSFKIGVKYLIHSGIQMSRSFLKVTGWRTLSGFVKLILKRTAGWSPEGLPFVSPRHGSETVGIPINKELMSYVMTTSKVWPFLCVGPTTCCTNPWASNVPLKRTASASLTLSRWKLRSPDMITSLVITASRSKYKLHWSKNTMFLKPFRLEGSGRYKMHNLTFT